MSPSSDGQPTSEGKRHEAAEWIVVGRVTGAWGIRGEVKVEPLTDAPHRFNSGGVLYLDEQPTRVLGSRKQKGQFVLKLDGVEDRNRAETLAGVEISVPRDQVSPLPAGSYYHFQIIGLEVWSEKSVKLGTVREILQTGAHDVYVVAKDQGGDLLLPAVAEVVLEVDEAHGRVVVRVPEGLR